MRTISSVACVLTLCLFLGGCGRKRFSIAAPGVPTAFGKSIYTESQFSADLAAYKAVLSDATKAKTRRNTMAYGLMGEIDDAYGQYAKGLFTGKGTSSVVSDSVQLGLTASATIARPPMTKTIFSALATALTGVSLSYDKNFFAQQTFSVLASAMQTRRDKARTEIITKLKCSDITTYPWTAVQRDLVSSFYAGTLTGGLQELQEQTGSAAERLKLNLH